MSKVSKPARRRRAPRPRADDPRVVRTRAAAIAAARTLFLTQGYAGTTMDQIAEAAGLTKRTLYNNYADKDALFLEIVNDVLAYAERFARGIRDGFAAGLTGSTLETALADLARRLALGILRPEVMALRRLLIGEARHFPTLARDYFRRAPGQVIRALAAEFARLDRAGWLRVGDARRAAAQFAYLVAGEALDRAMLVGTLPSRNEVVAAAQEGVRTFLARYAAAPGGRSIES